MSRFKAVVTGLVGLLVVAPWAIGKLAERHVNRGLDRFVEQVPYLTIVDRNYRPGWFRSEQVVTFEVQDDLTPLIKLWMELANARASTPANDSRIERDDPREAASRDRRSLKSPARSRGPRFTVRNEILHGPVLWPFGLGTARVNTRVDWSVKLKHEFIKFFGDDQPIRMKTRIGFLGGATTTVWSPERSLELSDGGRVEWDDLEFDLKVSRNGDVMKLRGSWPRFEMESAYGSQFVMRGFKADGTAKRIAGQVFDTDAVFAIDSLRMGNDLEIEDLEYEAITSIETGFVDYSLRFGSGPVSLRNYELREVHYDFSFRRLHIPSLDKLTVAMRESYSKTREGFADDDPGMIDALMQHGFALLEHDPEFVIDRINVVTAAGDGTLTGTLRFKGLTQDDLNDGVPALLRKLEAEIQVDIAESLIEQFAGESDVVAKAVEDGTALRGKGRITSSIEYRRGKLRINGKVQEIPGLGGQPEEFRLE